MMAGHGHAQEFALYGRGLDETHPSARELCEQVVVRSALTSQDPIGPS